MHMSYKFSPLLHPTDDTGSGSDPHSNGLGGHQLWTVHLPVVCPWANAPWLPPALPHNCLHMHMTQLASEVSSVSALTTHTLMIQAQLENYGLESEAQWNHLKQLKICKYSTYLFLIASVWILWYAT